MLGFVGAGGLGDALHTAISYTYMSTGQVRSQVWTGLQAEDNHGGPADGAPFR